MDWISSLLVLVHPPLLECLQVVFVVEDGVAKMMPVKRGISDDSHTEIVEGLEEGQEVVTGGYRVISRDLEDGKKVRVGGLASEEPDRK